ncbi:MAG: 50S ribosomal protein L9 [Candidatus Brocadiales bacterium]
MKVLLRKNIEKLGSMGDVVAVADGYARNFLFPKGFATTATSANAKEVEIRKRKEALNTKLAKDGLGKLAKELAGFEFSIAAKAHEEGRLFGSVTPAGIAEELVRRGYSVEEDFVRLEEHIKECGTYDVTLDLYPGIKTQVKLFVVKEEEVVKEE